MKKAQILRKAIEKAKKNGYDSAIKWGDVNRMANLSLNGIIFDHSFAKAFWGNEEVDSYGFTEKEHKARVEEGWHYPIDYEWSGLDLAWGYHLKALVLAEDRLLYLSKFLK